MKNIILIGMPGAGKSTLGVVLAKALGMAFVDTDLLIQKSCGKLLQGIIDEQGLDHFIRIEEDIVSELKLAGTVVATGGSVVYSEKAMGNLKKNGLIIYLNVGFKEIEKRLKNISTRGIAMKKGDSLEELYAERVPLYRHYADIVVDCSGKDLEQCVNDIVANLQGPERE